MASTRDAPARTTPSMWYEGAAVLSFDPVELGGGGDASLGGGGLGEPDGVGVEAATTVTASFMPSPQ